jgi:hypothetical protein
MTAPPPRLAMTVNDPLKEETIFSRSSRRLPIPMQPDSGPYSGPRELCEGTTHRQEDDDAVVAFCRSGIEHCRVAPLVPIVCVIRNTE